MDTTVSQSNAFHPTQLFVALIFGVFMSVVIWYGHKWFQDYFLSKCSSKSCARCNNFESVQKTAVERFHEMEKLTSIDISVRIKLAITGEELEKMFKYATQKPNILYIPNLNTKAWLDSTEYYVEDTKRLRRAFSVISEEFEKVFTMCRQNWVINKVPTGYWAIFHLMNQGKWIKENCDLCPKTVETIRCLKNHMDGCVFANSGFSVLQPNTEIEQHFGPTNARLRCHLALKVTHKSSITVDNETRHWKTGNCLLFDDSFLHSSKHAGTYLDGPRAILIVDLWNPWLTLTERYIVQKCYSPSD